MSTRRVIRRPAVVAAERPPWYRERVTAEKSTDDRITRSLIDGGRARVVVATATATVKEMAERHEIFGIPAVVLGRSAVAGLLLATLTKDEEQVTFQVLGDGPLAGVTVDARSSGRVRGFVKRPHAVAWDEKLAISSPIRIGDAIGRNGVVSVVRDLGMAHNYSGQVALSSGEIAEEVESYLITSEQIDSVVRCDVLLAPDGHVTAAAGLLVQTLPQAHGAALVEFVRDSLRGPVFTTVLADALAQGKVEPDFIANAALGDCTHDMRTLDERAVTFFCPCSRERAESTLGLLRHEDLKDMLLEDNQAEVKCNFCGAKYRFSEIELERLRRMHDKNTARA
jgi:molecular chaperone Hsp33